MACCNRSNVVVFGHFKSPDSHERIFIINKLHFGAVIANIVSANWQEAAMKTTRLALLIFSMLLTGIVWAQPAQPGPEQPGGEGIDQGVARISLINGDVSVRRGDSGDWVSAAVNAPLMANDTIFAGSGSRAEVQFDYANMIRLGSDSEVHMAELDNQRYLLQMARGIVTFRVLRNSSADVEISTPSISVRPRAEGTYRIEVQPDGITVVTVRAGQAEIFSPQGAQTVSAGRAVLVRGDPSNPEFQVVTAPAPDDWDRWNDYRDNQLLQTQAYQYVSPAVYGAEDLDAYGTWVTDSTYGPVWSPRVAAGWSPYSAGRWMWGDSYGWTWISYDPWGWAPYHYGRWFYAGGRGWCWWPGGRGYQAWSPALVAFVGFGGGGIGLGRVGWVPLAPHEPFHRWWGSGAYRGNTTIVNNVNVYNSYRNARINNGVMMVKAADFGRGRGGHFNRATQGELRQAEFIRGQLPVVPNRDSLRMANRPVQTRNLPRGTENTRFFSHRQPAPDGQASFDQQRRGMEQRFGADRMGFNASGSVAAGSGRVGTAGWRNLGAGAPAVAGRGATPPHTGAGLAGNGGWRSMERPSPNAATGQTGSTRGTQDGWHHFDRSSGYTRPANTGDRQQGVNRTWQRMGAGPAVTESEQPNRGARSAPSGNNQRQMMDSPANTRQRWFGSGNEPVRINPPMVRQRDQERSNYAAPRRESNAGGWNRPSMNSRPMESRPTMSAPRMESNGNRGWGGGAPRMSSGGGFGGARGGGSHGGGGHGGGRRR